jgi:DNA-binding response OmpR family regulator
MAEVILVRWPEEGADGEQLAREGVAVLYLVGADGDPPIPTSRLEDWVRVPGDERDLHARVALLELRAAVHAAPPRVDGDGRVHYRGRALSLSGSVLRLATVLTERFGEVVTDRELNAAAFGTSTSSSTLRLQRQVAELRARLRGVGLVVRRVRRRGYQLQDR